jgi:hypothetical protein
MATGFETYITLMYDQPTAAYSLAIQHLTALAAMRSSPRSGADSVSYDPTSLDLEMARVEKDIRYLVGVTRHIGQPRLVPTRRIDNSPWPVPGQGNQP